MTSLTLDLRGLQCPLPVLRTRKALRSLQPGALLVVQSTDPLAALDIPHLIGETGNRLVSVEAVDGGHVFSIEKC